MTDKKQYAERDFDLLISPYYSRHTMAMTGEQLNNKADIAAELAYRDREIDRLTERLNKLAHADRRLGRWLSAALEDPNVCDEMREDIHDWFLATSAEVSQVVYKEDI